MSSLGTLLILMGCLFFRQTGLIEDCQRYRCLKEFDIQRYVVVLYRAVQTAIVQEKNNLQ